MRSLVFEVPTMYGDHHVLLVRQALVDMAGVHDVTASAARRIVMVRFDETVATPEAISSALEVAGYPPERQTSTITFPKRHEDDSSWFSVPVRTTTTERKDREMAGDFRRY
jgi:copper chaperone CopZ